MDDTVRATVRRLLARYGTRETAVVSTLPAVGAVARAAVTVVALSFSEILESILEVFLLLQWQLPVLPIVCVVLGVLTARKTHRSLFNWVLVGVSPA